MLLPVSYAFDIYFIFLEAFVVGDVIVFSLEVVAVVYVHNANSTFFFLLIRLMSLKEWAFGGVKRSCDIEPINALFYKNSHAYQNLIFCIIRIT